VFKAFLKLDTGDKFILDCDADKNALLVRLAEYNKTLNTNILDNSDIQNPYWITAV
jgi:hypothetical protein